MNHFMLFGIFLLLLLTACTPESPQQTIEAWGAAAEASNAEKMWDVLSEDYIAENGLNKTLYIASLTETDFTYWSDIRIKDIFDKESVTIVVLENGARIFLVEENNTYKIREIAK